MSASFLNIGSGLLPTWDGAAQVTPTPVRVVINPGRLWRPTLARMIFPAVLGGKPVSARGREPHGVRQIGEFGWRVVAFPLPRTG